MNHVAEPIYLKMELPEDAKKFYDEATPEDACSWVESYINAAILTETSFYKLIEMGCSDNDGADSLIIGAVQKIIDTVGKCPDVSDNAQAFHQVSEH